MKPFAIVYSSRTGNTKRVAEALLAAAPEQFDIFDAAEQPDLTPYRLIAFGYGVDRSGPYESCKSLMRSIENKTVILFQTLGAEAMGEHAMTCLANGGACLGAGNYVLGTFSCQGAIDPKVIEMMRKMPLGPHSATPENEARWAAAASHPDADDLARATEFMKYELDVYDRFFTKMMQQKG